MQNATIVLGQENFICVGVSGPALWLSWGQRSHHLSPRAFKAQDWIVLETSTIVISVTLPVVDSATPFVFIPADVEMQLSDLALWVCVCTCAYGFGITHRISVFVAKLFPTCYWSSQIFSKCMKTFFVNKK